VTPLLAWSPFGGVLESNFWTPASLAYPSPPSGWS